jgi:hypothetical protein
MRPLLRIPQLQRTIVRNPRAAVCQSERLPAATVELPSTIGRGTVFSCTTVWFDVENSGTGAKAHANAGPGL